MAICMGVLRQSCRKVHVISRLRKSDHVHFDRTRGEFRLMCIPPCRCITSFHRGMLKPYSIPSAALERGYADMDECCPIFDVKATRPRS
jgi:hypothetical protein